MFLPTVGCYQPTSWKLRQSARSLSYSTSSPPENGRLWRSPQLSARGRSLPISSYVHHFSASQVVALSLIRTVQTNCLTEIFVDRALERAAWLDEQLKSTGKVVGPLHGLPISLKDQIRIKGLETIMGTWTMYSFGVTREMDLGAVSGYVSWIGKVAERNASLTEILIESGAVLYVRTNVPQTLMVRFTFLSPSRCS
jgi:Asp-tRNA(Asn)/Glu-tRNA(Gln) amidotransferase A subunit family amidase